MKCFKRIIAAAAACAMVLSGVLTVTAEDTFYALRRQGSAYSLVGKGAGDDSIVINLNGKSKVTATYYTAAPVRMEAPEYIVKVEDVPDKDDAEIKVVYNETLGMYGIEITAKELTNETFVIRYLKKTGSNYEAFAVKSVELMVIDGEDYKASEEISDTEYSAIRSQAASTNVAQGLNRCADGQSITIDISDTNRISNSWLKTLKNYPNKSLICTGEDYAWTVKGSDVRLTSTYLSHYVGVSFQAANQEELEKACGITNVRPVIVSGMKKFPASASLTVHMSGVAYKNAAVNIYKYENGKVLKVAEGIQSDENGCIAFPGATETGTYLVSLIKSPKAV